MTKGIRIPQDDEVWPDTTVPEVAVAACNSLFDRLRRSLANHLPTACECIIELESTPIPTEMRVEAVTLLGEFVRANLDSSDERVVVAICAAIRKSMLNCRVTELDFAGDLFRACAGQRQQLAVELEIFKMIVHRATRENAVATAALKTLREGMFDRVKQYSVKQEIEKEFVGATALNAALAIVYLRDERAPRLVQYIREQSPAWFFDSFEHRLRRFVKSMGDGNEGYEPRDARLMQTVEFIRELECAALQG